LDLSDISVAYLKVIALTRPRLRATEYLLEIFQTRIGICDQGFEFCLERH